MAVFPGTPIPIGVGSTPRRVHLIDDLLTPRLLSFRQIHIWDETPVRLMSDNETFRLTFGNILEDAPLEIVMSGKRMSDDEIDSFDYDNGTFKFKSPIAVEIGADGIPLDSVSATYVWDYFPVPVLEGLLLQAMATVNTASFGAMTQYTLERAPVPWEGVIADLAFAGAMERLLMDYNLWRYRLVMAIGPEQVESGSDNIPSQLQTLKANAEERASRTMQNEKFKCGEIVAGPTRYYYDAVRGVSISGAHGIPFLGGKLNGFQPNRLF